MFIVEGVLSILLAGVPRGRSVDDCIVRLDSDCKELIVTSNEQGKMADILISSSLDIAISSDLASIRQVRDVLVESVRDSLLVWIIAENPERAVRDRIFQKEMDLMDAFPEINFDFNLIPAMGRDVTEIATDSRVVYSRSQ